MTAQTRATVVFRLTAILTAVALSLFIALEAYRFGLIADPDGTDRRALLFFLATGLVTQFGLSAAPWALSRGRWIRIATALLMFPSAAMLLLSAWGGAARYVSGNPITGSVWVFYVSGACVYVWAYVALVRQRS